MYFFTTAKAQSRQGDLPYDDAEIDAKLKQIRADLEELKLKRQINQEEHRLRIERALAGIVPPGTQPKAAAEPPEAVEPKAAAQPPEAAEPKAAATPPEAEEPPRHV